MKGPVTDPKFSWDRKAVSEKIKTDVAREKQTLKEIFRQEFGAARKDTAKTTPKKKKEEMQIDWEESK